MKPSKTAKLQDYKTKERIESIQKYANKNNDGVFTLAVNKLVDEALKSTKNK